MTINLQVINRCLISVSNKTNIVKLAKFLEKNQVEIISTGGTYKLLKENKIKLEDILIFWRKRSNILFRFLLFTLGCVT